MLRPLLCPRISVDICICASLCPPTTDRVLPPSSLLSPLCGRTEDGKRSSWPAHSKTILGRGLIS